MTIIIIIVCRGKGTNKWVTEWMADFEKPCFSLELEIFKSTTNGDEPAPAVETLSMSEMSNQDGNRNL